MQISLVRCGQTEECFLRKIEGRKNVLMNDSGRRQCQRLRNRIQDNVYDYCFMSPLVRCVETAMILIGDRVEMIPDKRLIDRDMGELEGNNREEYNLYKFWDYTLNKSDYNVEPLKELFSRCRDFLDYLKQKYNDCNVIIVTHEEVYRCLRHLLLNHTLKGNLLEPIIENCQIESFKL